MVIIEQTKYEQDSGRSHVQSKCYHLLQLLKLFIIYLHVLYKHKVEKTFPVEIVTNQKLPWLL